MNSRGRLLQAEADLESLITRIRNVLPTLQRATEDAPDGWQKEIRSELLSNLRQTLETAEHHQIERRQEAE
jgi:hypothetical protein